MGVNEEGRAAPVDGGASAVTSQDAEQDTPRAGERPRRRLPTGFATLRDVLSFAAGMAIIGNEVFLSSTAEPAVIAVGVTMTGLPLVFGADERRSAA